MKQKLAIHQLRTLSRSRKKQQEKQQSFEQKVLSLQSSFLTPGLHYVSVPNQEQGRTLLHLCLDSLGMYDDISMLSMSIRGCPEEYHDLYQDLEAYTAFSPQGDLLEEYMLSSFHCDFLILEYTQELIEQPWFGQFEYLLSKHSVARSIPVVVCLYDEGNLIQN